MLASNGSYSDITLVQEALSLVSDDPIGST